MESIQRKITIVAILGLLTGVSAWGDDIRLGEPSYGGTGCPGGTVATALSHDAKTLSIIFDGFVTEAGGYTGKRVDRKSCQIALPVHVPQGYSFSIVQIDYRGFNSLPRGGRSQFTAEYFLAFPGAPAGRGLRYNRSFMGPLTEDYLISNALSLEAVVWSPCGRDVNLRTVASLMAQTNGYQEQVMSTLDSMDISAGVIYQLQWRRCN
ncbi:MAG: DUF4360 domain-containing protein [Oligoflexia bacterium]|nr:DUF4360 domain-containing protein [Oligoflexia bacterium]